MIINAKGEYTNHVTLEKAIVMFDSLKNQKYLSYAII
jgi:hypothetical protein